MQGLRGNHIAQLGQNNYRVPMFRVHISLMVWRAQISSS